LKCEFLVIGQGLAGTLVGHALEEMDASFVVMDRVRPYAASPIAAGIIHPISGRRFVKAWGYDTLMPVFKDTYSKIGLKLKFDPLQSQALHIYLSSNKEENDLLSQAQRYGYSDQLNRLSSENLGFKSENRCYSIPSFKVDIQSIIDLFRKRWLDQNKYFTDLLDYSQLQRVQDKWHYRDVVADHVIFCEGIFVKDNPWFSNLPVVANKGQILLLDKNEDHPLNSTRRRTMLFTEFKGKIWAGATYEWDFDTPAPDSRGWQFLTKKLAEEMISPSKIHCHLAGLRPTVADRKPIIASHPVYPDLWTINGFGTKGASVGPFVIAEFIRLITGREKFNSFAPDRLKEFLP